jgi:hypothetical protein
MFQFFTTDSDWDSTPFPIDHFYYADSRKATSRESIEKGTVVHLETHATSNTGRCVSIVSGEQWEEFDDIPSALRKMADIIEAHTKQVKFI